MATTNFYNINSIDLINKYDNANMSSLHQLLIKHIPKKSNVLDVGFGSGRDLQFLFDNGYDIWGIDPSIAFVNNIKERFSTKKDHFFKAAIPFGTNIIDIDTKFNAVISIAAKITLRDIDRKFEDNMELHNKYAEAFYLYMRVVLEEKNTPNKIYSLH